MVRNRLDGSGKTRRPGGVLLLLLTGIQLLTQPSAARRLSTGVLVITRDDEATGYYWTHMQLSPLGPWMKLNFDSRTDVITYSPRN